MSYELWAMKHLITIILTSIVVAACTLETSDNGDLDGFWHLKAVDTLSTGGVADYGERQVFWSFQGKLYEMREYTNDIAVTGHFQKEGDSLFVTDVYRYDRMNDDPAVEDASELYIYGANAICEHYLIVHLSSGSMTLQSKTLRLNFKKQ